MSKARTLFPRKSITKVTIKTVSLVGAVITLLQYPSKSVGQTSLLTVSPEAISQIQALEQEKASRSVQMRKIGSQIIYALKAKRGDSLFTKVPALRNPAITDDKGRVKVVIHTLSPLSNSLSLLDRIKAIAGVEIVNAPTNLNRIIALIPLDFVETIAEEPDIKIIQGFVRPGVSGTGLEPGRNAGSVNTEADIAHAAANVRAAYGINGSGVKIGVISDSYPASYFNPFYGKSAAAPHAAAIAALVKSYKPNLSAAQIRNILTSTALDIEGGGYDRDSGYGIVMADRALSKAQIMR